MDLQSLVAAHVADYRRLAPMDALAEDEYFRDQMTLPRLKLLLLAPMAKTAGVIILLVVIAQV